MNRNLGRVARRSCTFLVCLIYIAGAGRGLGSAAEPDALLAGFRNPPQAARPQVWWHWLSGNISLEGAKLDLAWMHRIGIGGVHAFTGGGFAEPALVNPRIEFMGESWKQIFRATTQIAHSYGMEVTISGAPGWSETGNVWVAPEHAMKKYVWSETALEGGKAFDGALAAPPSTTGPFMRIPASRWGAPPKQLHGDLYRDSYVIAYKTPAADLAVGRPQWRTSAGTLDLSATAAGDLAHAVELPIEAGQRSAWMEAKFAAPTTLAALTLGQDDGVDVEVMASADGTVFRSLLVAPADDGVEPCAQRTVAFAPTRATVFRVVLTPVTPRKPFPGLPAQLARPRETARSFKLWRVSWAGAARVNRFESKAGFQSSLDSRPIATPVAAADAVIARDDVVDLTARFHDGRLRWTAPPGQWTVLRFGWSLTGQTNGPTDPQDTGLEVDKLDAELVRQYAEQYLGQYAAAIGSPLGAPTVQNLLTDSWEAGIQNWTPSLLEQFAARRGYDPVPYLPVLAGRVVVDAATSDRFLWDYYRTLQELLADNHYSVLAQVLHEHGMGYYTEAQGDTPRAIGDGLTIKARADIPTAEYWYREFASPNDQASLKADLKEAASAGHVYGKPLIAAESLTVAAGTDPWSFSPAMLKPVADYIFAQGINRILMHESHHQPLIDAKPGMMLGFFGEFFNRNDTWADEAGPWMSYLARTSYLLQQGRYVADVAFLYGEERNLTERYGGGDNHEVPPGYGYDYVNPEALLTRLAVKDGALVTPSGMRYRVLYVPAYVERMTLPVLQKLRDLVAQGAVLVGRAPSGSLGLPARDAEVAAIAAELWGSSSGAAPKAETAVLARVVGKGRVYAMTDLAAALRAEGVAPDVAVEGSVPERVLSLHRQDGLSEIYFISHRRNHPETVALTFRVKGKVPELWHAEDGRVEALSYSQSSAGVRVVLPLEANEAVFVVLRRQAIKPTFVVPTPIPELLATIEGPWQVQFQTGRGAPAHASFAQLTDWRESSDQGVKYFSGEATYEKIVDVPPRWAAGGQRLFLDLGDVRELAVMSVDGKEIATGWHPPYQVDVTAALSPGRHRLAIKVVNLWVNRLIGDKQPGATAIAFAPQSPYVADSPLLASGLLGPVRVLRR